jgi:two-component system LytT family response regulator
MRTIIIDDEPDNVQLLAIQLGRHCPKADVVGQFTDSIEALKNVGRLRPELVFLDIEMPVLNGFQFLERVGDISFGIIFVTAYDQYAVKAFRFSALDYLLKPVDTIDLVAAVNRAEKMVKINVDQLELLRQHYPGGPAGTYQRIALPQANGLVFIELSQIIYCEADSNYTRFFLQNGESHLVSKTLGDVQTVLESKDFVRVHRQYLVKVEHIKKFVKGEGNYIVLTNGFSIPVARPQKSKLMERFGWI